MKVNRSAPNLVVICVDSHDEEGRMYHKYSKEAVAYHQYGELLLELEELFDAIGCPQASVKSRRFDDKPKKADASGRPVELAGPAWDVEELLTIRGKLATLVVHVKWRQSATWQGECYWVEGEQNAFFMSELEFLKLIETFVRR